MQSIPISEISPREAEFTVLDFETTGQSANTSRVIEIGLVKIKNYKVVDTYKSFLNPDQHIPYFITQLTGISNFDVVNAPSFDEIINDITNFVGNSILVAHNMSFDYSFLKREYFYAGIELFENPTLCTLKLARRLYPTLPSKSLGNLVKHFRIRHKGVHRALGDATATAKILIKMLKLLQEEHNVQKVSEVLNFQTSATQSKLKLVKKSLVDDLIKLPDSSGVYFFKNKKNEIIYIGKAKNLKKRANNYFSSNAVKKAKNIVKKATRLDFKKTNSELTALLTEATLIKEHKPPFNSQLKKYSNQLFIRVNLLKPFPDLTSTGILDFDGNDYFGPYNNRDTVKTLIDIVNKTYKLRECTEKDFKKQKKCYLKDIERCLAPCEVIDENSYKEELEKAYNFLCGNNQDAVNRLLGKMKAYSEKQKFEDAALIRDNINTILSQLNRASILAEPINNANVLIIVKDGIKKDYILLLEGRVFIKDSLADDKNMFETALADYFENTRNLFNGIDKKDLEQMKISLSWLVKNRTKVKIYYLKEYSSLNNLQKVF